jgi:hypothetical protein
MRAQVRNPFHGGQAVPPTRGSRVIVSWFDMPCAERGNRTIRIHTRLASASRRPRTMRRRARHIAESLSASIACCGAVKPCRPASGRTSAMRYCGGGMRSKVRLLILMIAIWPS